MPQDFQGVNSSWLPVFCRHCTVAGGSCPPPAIRPMFLFLPETKNCLKRTSVAHRFSDCCEPSRETGADGHGSFLPALLSLVEAPVHLLARLGDLFSLYLFIYFNWRRLWRVSWTSGRSNQSILKEINPEYSLEGLTLKLKLQYLGPLMQRANSMEKTLMLGKIEGRKRKGWQRMR